ncbi:hypothetical protein KIN20_018487 [Parelaphostrongylus tenuis]|uniref:Uncharacterized protein n=1 Tax=Parelaphostrongylus tenuis TaxID=148309 RepID=A0AAD5N4A8_PARTN|nr:hypothetical protein KIN20_018487 [Parelaphostrongylus tenuis]
MFFVSVYLVNRLPLSYEFSRRSIFFPHFSVTSYDISSMPKSTIPHGTKDIPASCEMALRRSRPTIQSHSNKSRSIIFLINSFLFEEYILRRSSGVQRTLGIL